jgi:hypothetical protein
MHVTVTDLATLRSVLPDDRYARRDGTATVWLEHLR